MSTVVKRTLCVRKNYWLQAARALSDRILWMRRFLKADIADTDQMQEVFKSFRPDVVVHLAAQTHVDRSIDAPSVFIQNNVVATQKLLEVSRHYWERLKSARKERFRFIYVSTDEVYGSLKADEKSFTLNCPYRPASPYAASKAAGHVWFPDCG